MMRVAHYYVPANTAYDMETPYGLLRMYGRQGYLEAGWVRGNEVRAEEDSLCVAEFYPRRGLGGSSLRY